MSKQWLDQPTIKMLCWFLLNACFLSRLFYITKTTVCVCLCVLSIQSVALQSTDQDYLHIQKLFRTTLAGFQIDRIERIQNKKLWEDFQM